MRSDITIAIAYDAGSDVFVLGLECERAGCGWTRSFGYGPQSIEVVNEVAADHWAGHVFDAGADLLRIVREMVTDLRLRIDEILTDARKVDQAPATTSQDPVSGPEPAPGADREAEAAERLQVAHGRVWRCADCGSAEVTVRAESDGTSIKCNACGAKRYLVPAYQPPDPLDDAGFPVPGDAPEQIESD